MAVKGELHLKSWDRRGARKSTLLIYETRIVWDGLHLPHSPKTRDSLERVENQLKQVDGRRWWVSVQGSQCATVQLTASVQGNQQCRKLVSIHL